ncbi:MAG TPA: ABC-type transport auxiliary lipoprotein family protein [Gammaproteobacteria bacterium]|nr:ABC-type transport auxiliary lipoprotein family protein [Gammaproteobacteria bacterium]
MAKHQSRNARDISKRCIVNFRTILSLGLLLSLAGCSLLSPVKTPPNNQYTLSAAGATRTQPVRENRPTLLIATPAASPGYDTTNMIYLERPFQLNHYANHHWVSPPAEMLTPILEQKLRNSGCFRAALGLPSSGTADYILNTELLALQQEFIGGRNQVRLALLATLINGASQQILAQRRFEAVVPAYQVNPYSGVVAANEAMAIVTQKLATFLCRYADE